MEKEYSSKWSLKQTELAILRSNKIDFQPKVNKRDREGHYLLIKEKKNPPRRHLNSIHLGSTCKGTHIHIVNTTKV